MKEEIRKRFTELIMEGHRLISLSPKDEHGPEYWVQEDHLFEYQKWIDSTVNLIKIIDRIDGIFNTECDRLLQSEDMKGGISTSIIQRFFGILQSANDEWERGLLRKIEHIIIAEAFDNFLDYASDFHKGDKKIESSVLSSIVLEDTIKRIAKKNSLDTKGKSLDLLIDELIKANIFTSVKGKRIKGFAGVRNHALHAEWDSFDIRDVGELISGVRELLEHYF